MSDSIEIKDYKVLKGFLLVPYHHKLIALLMWVVTRYSKVVFTSSYREGDEGVHGTIPCRGTNIRSWIYNDPQSIVDDINKHWIYHPDPEKRHNHCALLHDSGEGEHIHLKTHDKTVYLSGKELEYEDHKHN